MNTQQLANLLLPFINAKSWNESKRIVEAHPVLLTAEAEVVLSEIMDQYSGDELATRLLQECQQLLARCRTEGIDAAFANGLRTEVPLPQLVNLFMQLINADSSAKSKQLIEANPVLLTAEAEVVLSQIMDQYSGDERVTRLLQEHQQLLARCRTEGIDAAFADRLRAEVPPPQLLNLFMQLINTDRWAESKELVETNPVLLTPKAEMVLSQIMNQYRGDEQATRLLQEHEQLLARCRTEGIDAAFADRLRTEMEPPQLLNLLMQLINTDSWAESKELVEANPALLTPEADAVLSQLITQYSGDEEVTRVLREHQQLLARCLREGIDAAFADLIQPTSALMAILDQLNAEFYDMPHRIALCGQALGLVSKDRQPVLWATLQGELGNSLAQNFLDNWADNLEQAIYHYGQALQVMNRQTMPMEWAQTMNNLAAAYQKRIYGERGENIEQAISYYQQALEVRTRQAMPAEWAETMNNLATAYSNRIHCEPAENIEQAIEYYQQTLQVRTRQAMPIQWAETMINLASAYHTRIWGEQAENIEQAIDYYEQILQVISRHEEPSSWALIMMNLANAYSDRISGEPAENIEEAISYYQQALQVRTREAMPFEWAETMMNLANAYSKRIRGERAENIEQAIEYYQEALQVWSHETESVECATIMINLAITYEKRIRGERAENIEQAIKYYQQALQPLEAMPLRWAITIMNLANAYSVRIRGERAENIEQAIEYYQEALQLLEAIPVEWAEIMTNLANSYQNRIRGERAENIEQAIEYYQQALQVRTREAQPLEWAQTINNLAIAYFDRIRGERAENIEQAIEYYQQVLQVISREAMPIRWGITVMNLASAVAIRIRGERAQNIEQAIELYEEALQLLETMPLEWAEVMMNLANVYRDRVHGKRAENIEQAILYYKQALQVRTRQAIPFEWAETITNLAIAYQKRIRGERAANLEQAIEYYQQALQVKSRQAMPFEWLETMIGLASAYFERIRGGVAENLEIAIKCYKQVLQVATRQAMPLEWAETMNNLANAYADRVHGNPAENIEQAISYYEQALQVVTRQAMPVEWATTMMNLASAYYSRIEGNRAENIEEAIKGYQEALQVFKAMPTRWASTMNNLANAYRDRMIGEPAENISQAIAIYEEALSIQTVVAIPDKHRDTQRNLAHLYFKERRWADAHTAIAAALAASDLLYQASGTTEARQLELGRLRKLSARAAYSLAKHVLKDEVLGRFSEAVETLEQGKARVLAETLTRQEAVLERARKEDQAAFTAVRERIRELEAEARAEGESWARDFLTVSADLRQVRDELGAIVARIRQYLPDFMPEGLDWAAIKSVANTLHQPLVYLLTTSHGSLALIERPNQREEEKKRAEVEALWLDDFQTDELNKILYDQNEVERYLHGTVLASTSAEIEAFKQLLDEIWPRLDNLMLPIATRLAQLGYQQAVLIPSGTLSLLPLHALVPKINLTVAPSARALQTALDRQKERAHLPPTLLGIGNPLPNPKPLPFARLEVEEISPLFGTAHTFYEKAATREAVSGKIKALTHLHFSCHGAFNIQKPLESALYLAGDDTLTLRDLLDGGFDLSAAQLAVLSACQTGITDFQNVPDEAIGFPAGFLQAGVPGVISTLWPVTDISTALLLMRFYRYHLEEGLAPAKALYKAQKWLRDATTQELGLAEYYKRVFQNARRREEKAKAFVAMRHYQAYPDAKPFAHPYYWAAFVFSGV